MEREKVSEEGGGREGEGEGRENGGRRERREKGGGGEEGQEIWFDVLGGLTGFLKKVKADGKGKGRDPRANCPIASGMAEEKQKRIKAVFVFSISEILETMKKYVPVSELLVKILEVTPALSSLPSSKRYDTNEIY
jgi:hypothetical protein